MRYFLKMKTLKTLQSCRPIVRPNPGFFRQLIDYESRLFGKATVKMGWNAAAGTFMTSTC